MTKLESAKQQLAALREEVSVMAKQLNDKQVEVVKLQGVVEYLTNDGDGKDEH